MFSSQTKDGARILTKKNESLYLGFLISEQTETVQPDNIEVGRFEDLSVNSTTSNLQKTNFPGSLMLPSFSCLRRMAREEKKSPNETSLHCLKIVLTDFKLHPPGHVDKRK